MDPITPIPRSQYIQNEFSRIAHRYELMNQLMTFGSVNRWRKAAIRLLDVHPGQQVLDLGAGGGQLTRLILDACSECVVFPSDFNIPMMLVGKETGLPFYAADALHLPHQDNSMDRVICAFLLRNIQEYPLAIKEILRILKSGGKFVCLDTTPPTNRILQPFIRLYMRLAIPLIGSLVTGRLGAYQYLIKSSENFARTEKLAQDFQYAGFKQVGFKRIMFGTAAIHWGSKE
jgi:demethylmenaquinone methyltransferase / 2-methoxy-6-polyprenyl-1,4-benzoquinol methylase